MERPGGGGCKQALWHVHTNHPHLGDDDDDDDNENERKRDERKRRKDGEERMREETREEEEEEEGHWCVHGVPETAYGNGGVC